MDLVYMLSTDLCTSDNIRGQMDGFKMAATFVFRTFY